MYGNIAHVRIGPKGDDQGRLLLLRHVVLH